MGKYVLLITFAGLLGMSYLGQQSLSTSQDTSEDLAERQRTVLARQIARSAFNKAASKLKRNWCTVPDNSSLRSYEQGEYRVTFASASAGDDSEEGEDDEGKGACSGKSITITATGYYPQAGSPDEVRYQIQGAVEQKTLVSGLFSGLTASGALSQLRVNGCGGGNCVSGVPPGGGQGRPGMNLPGSMAEDLNENGCPSDGWEKRDIVAGNGSVANECGVQVRSAADDEWVTGEMKKIESVLTSGGNADVTVCGNGNGGGPPGNGGGPPGNGGGPPGNGGGPFGFASMSYSGESVSNPPGSCAFRGNGGGSGILYVPPGESVRFNGRPTWNGLVYVAEGGSIRINGGGGVTNINGGLLMEENASFRMNGGNRIQYNPDELRKYVDLLPSIETTEITVTDRTAGVLQRDD